MVLHANALRRCTLVLLRLSMVVGQFLRAGTTGKIAGVVKDAESSEPLPLVNVTVKGTYLGTASDEKGRYHILSVPPGTYTLVVTMMGYTPVEVTNVKVSIDQSTRVDVAL